MKMSKRLLARAADAIAVVLLCGVLGTALLYLAYLLPTEPMKAHVRQSLPLYRQEWQYFEWAQSSTSRLDLQTDILMLGAAVYENDKSTLQQVMEGSSPCYDGPWQEWQLDALERYLDGEPSDYEYYYPRYWKGFLIFLKPLLLVFSPARLLELGMYVQLTLAMVLLYLANKRLGGPAALALGAGLMTLNPVSVALCFQYQTSCYVMLLACIGAMALDCLKEERARFCYFVLVGCATVYFDYLTYPVITLTMPLLLVLLRYFRKDRPLWQQFFHYVGLAVGWAVGYAALWMCKWLLATAVTGWNVVTDSVERVQYRMGGELDWVDVGPVNAVVRPVGTLLESPYLLVATAVLLVLAAALVGKGFRVNFQPGLSLLLAGSSMIPLLWFIVAANHSINHRFFTYRSLGATVFGLLMLLVVNLKPKRE